MFCSSAIAGNPAAVVYSKTECSSITVPSIPDIPNSGYQTYSNYTQIDDYRLQVKLQEFSCQNIYAISEFSVLDMRENFLDDLSVSFGGNTAKWMIDKIINSLIKNKLFKKFSIITPARDTLAHPDLAPKRRAALRRIARRHRWGCRRVDTSSRRCGTSEVLFRGTGAQRCQRCNLYEIQHGCDSCAKTISAISIRRFFRWNIIHYNMREIRLAGH